MAEELKPCPFCGGEARFETYGGTACAVVCQSCHCGTPTMSLVDGTAAVNRWNLRAERTCRYVRDHMGVAGNWFCKCSECGAEFDERVVDSHFVYCPECGAKVVSK